MALSTVEYGRVRLSTVGWLREEKGQTEVPVCFLAWQSWSVLFLFSPVLFFGLGVFHGMDAGWLPPHKWFNIVVNPGCANGTPVDFTTPELLVIPHAPHTFCARYLTLLVRPLLCTSSVCHVSCFSNALVALWLDLEKWNQGWPKLTKMVGFLAALWEGRSDALLAMHW